jgi:O-succinylhomoserine sulfhydrylase
MLHPGLASHPQHNLAMRQMKACGPIFSFVLDGGRASRRWRCSTRSNWSISPTISATAAACAAIPLIDHPLQRLGRATREIMGVEEGMLRINIGLEDPLDLIDDLDQALRKVGL